MIISGRARVNIRDGAFYKSVFGKVNFPPPPISYRKAHSFYFLEGQVLAISRAVSSLTAFPFRFGLFEVRVEVSSFISAMAFTGYWRCGVSALVYCA